MMSQNFRCIDHKDYILTEIKSGRSRRSIAKELGYSSVTIGNFAKCYGLGCKCNWDNENLLRNKLDDVLELRDSGHTIRDIARILGHGHCSISRLLKSNGYDTTRDIYNVDESFFEVINTKEKAYILGLIYADGSVCNRSRGYRFAIVLQDRDRYMLNNIAKIMKFDGPILQRKKYQEHHRDCYVLEINRKSLVNQLMRLGCVPNKSLKLTFPSSDIVPSQYLSHFFRGVWDGDGCLCTSRNKFDFSLVATKDFVDGVVDNVYKPLGISNYSISPLLTGDNGVTKVIRVRSKRYIPRLYDWLYKDASLFLSRKRDKFKCLL